MCNVSNPQLIGTALWSHFLKLVYVHECVRWQFQDTACGSVKAAEVLTNFERNSVFSVLALLVRIMSENSEICCNDSKDIHALKT